MARFNNVLHENSLQSYGDNKYVNYGDNDTNDTMLW